MSSNSPRGRRRKKVEQIDIAAILTKPVKVSKNGRAQRMAPYEIELRALVTKAVKEKSLSAIRTLIEVGVQHELIKATPMHRNGGVLVVPGRLTRESWAALFEAPNNADIENGNRRK